ALALLRDEVQEVAYNSAITACDNGGEWERALLLLQELERRGLCSTTTFNAALSACASASAWEAAAVLFAKAVRGHAADALTCNAYLKGLAASRQWAFALHLHEQMRERKIQPTPITAQTTAALLEDCLQRRRPPDALPAPTGEAWRLLV
ncbi:unnamed protein product, partial [Symbiodinium sp. CCMP2456]